MRIVGISSGLGVSLFPFKDHLIANIEPRGIFHTPGNEQWEANFGDIPLYKKAKSIKKIKGEVDAIISSPDCGSGSILRYSRAKKLGDHKLNLSLMLFYAAVRKIKPKFFLFENLPTMFKSFPKERHVDLLNNYYLIEHLAPVSKWGNSQVNRVRMIIVGIRRDLPYKELKKYFKVPDHQDQIVWCKDIYPDLGKKLDIELGHVREADTDIISIHARKRMTIKAIRKEWNGRLEGKKRWTVDGGAFKTAPGVYRNLNNDYPATARKANRQFDHTGRMLSPRQLARVQGIPDTFKIFINPDKLNYWINKGRTVCTKTPPYEISVWFKKVLFKTKDIWS